MCRQPTNPDSLDIIYNQVARTRPSAYGRNANPIMKRTQHNVCAERRPMSNRYLNAICIAILESRYDTYHDT